MYDGLQVPQVKEQNTVPQSELPEWKKVSWIVASAASRDAETREFVRDALACMFGPDEANRRILETAGKPFFEGVKPFSEHGSIEDAEVQEPKIATMGLRPPQQNEPSEAEIEAGVNWLMGVPDDDLGGSTPARLDHRQRQLLGILDSKVGREHSGLSIPCYLQAFEKDGNATEARRVVDAVFGPSRVQTALDHAPVRMGVASANWADACLAELNGCDLETQKALNLMNG